MVFTVEPMLNLGSGESAPTWDDGWTVVTKDRRRSAQFEHTVGVTETGVEIFTISPKGLHQPVNPAELTAGYHQLANRHAKILVEGAGVTVMAMAAGGAAALALAVPLAAAVGSAQAAGDLAPRAHAQSPLDQLGPLAGQLGPLAGQLGPLADARRAAGHLPRDRPAAGRFRRHPTRRRLGVRRRRRPHDGRPAGRPGGGVMTAHLTPVLSARWGDPEPWTLASYRTAGGYDGLERALTMTPDEVIALVLDGRLRGARIGTPARWRIEADSVAGYLDDQAEEARRIALWRESNAASFPELWGRGNVRGSDALPCII